MIKQFSLKRDGNTKISKNFTVKEFACKDGSDVVLIDCELVTILQCLRNTFGKPVFITSAYRTEEHNKSVGGAKNSQHLLGKAADIYIQGVSLQKIKDVIETIMPSRGGIIVYNKKGFVHIDTRETRYREVK